MRSNFVRLMSLAVAVTLSACGDGPSKPTTPVTLSFRTPLFAIEGTTLIDTVQAMVIVDATDTVNAPTDTILEFPRGVHSFEAHFDIDYFIRRFQLKIDPSGSAQVVNIFPAGTCRIFAYDRGYCTGNNFINHSGTRIFCPAGDFGEFCSYFPDAVGVGGSWPSDQAATAENEYIAMAKLLIGAVVPGGNRVAMSLYDPGDYSPRRRHHVDPADPTTWQSEVWTDARHVPLFPADAPILDASDRPRNVFGLSVRTTYSQPTAHKDALFVRFDVTNISDSADYRRVHADEPIGGHTITDVYLAPVIDPDVGGIRVIGTTRYDDTGDDNATLFPAESLLVGYDQAFQVPAFFGGYNNKPGLVGVRLLEAPAGTEARAIIFDEGINVAYGITPSEATVEDSTYRLLSAGRGGVHNNCTSYAQAFICSSGGNAEASQDIRMGWSIGPVASIAPGQTVSLTIAILMASPTPTTFQSGTEYPPVNSDLTSTTRAIYGIASQLRTLADQVKAVRVVGTPR